MISSNRTSGYDTKDNYIIGRIENILCGYTGDEVEYLHRILDKPSDETRYWLDVIYSINITSVHLLDTRMLTLNNEPITYSKVEDIVRDAALNEAFFNQTSKLTQFVIEVVIKTKGFSSILEEYYGSIQSTTMLYTDYSYNKFISNIENLMACIKHPPMNMNADKFDIVTLLLQLINLDYTKYASKISLLGGCFDTRYACDIVTIIILRLMQVKKQYKLSDSFEYWVAGNLRINAEQKCLNDAVKALMKPEINHFDVLLALLGLNTQEQYIKDKLYRMIHRYNFNVSSCKKYDILGEIKGFQEK